MPFRTIRGRRFYPAQIHQALRKRIYTGDFDFDGITYSGTHTPLVSRETWECVQAILNARTSSQSRQRKHIPHAGNSGTAVYVRAGLGSSSEYAALRRIR